MMNDAAVGHWFIVLDVSVTYADPAMRVRGNLLLVCHNNDGVPFLVQDVEQSHDLIARLAVEVAGRFISQKNRGVRDQGARNSYTLALSAGKFIRLVVRPVCETDAGNGFPGQALSFAATDAAVDEGKLDIVEDIRTGEQIECLEDKSDLLVPYPSQLIVVHVADVRAVELVHSGRRSVEAADNIHERRFPRTGRPHDGDILVLLDLDIQPR